MKSEEEYCIIDCRVSDKIQLLGGSLDNQEIIGRRVAQQFDALIAKIFKKPHSATTTERDDFQDVVDFIKNDPRNIKYYIIKSIDRLTREGYPEYLKLKDELEKIGIRVIDSEGIIQPKRNTLEHFGGDIAYRWSVHSPSEAGEMLEAYKRRSFFNTPFKNFHNNPFILTTEEVATLFHFPSAMVAATPTLARLPSKKAEAPANLPI